MTRATEPARLAAVGDIHCAKTAHGALQSLFAPAAARADVLVLSGNLTDCGLPEEVHILAKEITAAATIPIGAVLANHDDEPGTPDEIRQILADAGDTVLNGASCAIQGSALPSSRASRAALAGRRSGPGASRPSNASSKRRWTTR